MKNIRYIAQNEYVIVSDSGEITPEMERVIDSVTTSVYQQRQEEEKAHDSFITMLSVSIVLVIFGSFFGFWLFNNAYWGKGKFPPFTRFKRVNYYDSIVYIAVRFMLCDRDSYSNKLVLLSRFLKHTFPDVSGHPMDSVKAASETPVSVESTGFWLNKHLSKKEKEMLFRFFGEMAISDGGLGKREHEYLTIILKSWSLDKSLLREVEEEISSRKREEQTRDQRKTVVASVNLKEKFCRTLGLGVNAGVEEIKKAYRKLAMIHHPDKYHGKNDFEREAAKMKFIEIQEAYEYLVNLSPA